MGVEEQLRGPSLYQTEEEEEEEETVVVVGDESRFCSNVVVSRSPVEFSVIPCDSASTPSSTKYHDLLAVILLLPSPGAPKSAD
jgi:hypothetical protein